MEFVLGHPIDMEESLTYEFKEIKGSDPVQTIGKSVDEYAVAFLNGAGGSIFWGIRDTDRVVTGLRLDHQKRDLLRQVVGQKIGAIAPPPEPNSIDLPFHDVFSSPDSTTREKDLYVVEVAVKAPGERGLYLTGSGEAYRKTIGGKMKLSGAELWGSLIDHLQKKQQIRQDLTQSDWGPLDYMARSVSRRAELVAPLLSGARILWVDDIPSHTVFERTAFSTLGIRVEVASTSEEALFMLKNLQPDLIISDIRRGSEPDAGITFLNELRANDDRTPLIFYVGQVDPWKPKPPGSFGITNLPGELFHLALDALERFRSIPG